MPGVALGYLVGSVDYLSGGVITTVVFLEVDLVALWLAVGSARQRRSHFWVRVLIASLGLPALVACLIAVGQLNVLSNNVATALLSSLFFAGVIALMLVPGVLYRGSGPSPGTSESDGGGGPGPGRPPPSPDIPRGGLPLPDAEQASARVRDHTWPRFDELPRRPAHEPRRRPARTNG